MKRELHVTDVELGVIASRASTEWELMTMVRDEYEAARAKDAELIQDLLDSLVLLREVYQSATGSPAPVGNSALAAAEALGFKPTEK